MPLNFIALLEAPIIQLDTIDSTNNYAMRLIDADTAQAGLTITANEQTNGKGQRGRKWTDVPGQSLLMSLIAIPQQSLEEQFLFNAAATVAIAEVLQQLNEHWDVSIKWPNDIIINDKKAGGILIENIIRGNLWMYSIIGLGLNVRQSSFPADLPFATSLKIASGVEYHVSAIRDLLRYRIISNTFTRLAPVVMMQQYNEYLFRKGRLQGFSNNVESWEAIVIKTNENGTLQVQLTDGSLVTYVHGQVTWDWK